MHKSLPVWNYNKCYQRVNCGSGTFTVESPPVWNYNKCYQCVNCGSDTFTVESPPVWNYNKCYQCVNCGSGTFTVESPPVWNYNKCYQCINCGSGTTPTLLLHFRGENFGFVGPCVKERSSYAMSIPCAVAVSMSDLRKMIIRMSECRYIRPDRELENLRREQNMSTGLENTLSTRAVTATPTWGEWGSAATSEHCLVVFLSGWQACTEFVDGGRSENWQACLPGHTWLRTSWQPCRAGWTAWPGWCPCEAPCSPSCRGLCARGTGWTPCRCHLACRRTQWRAGRGAGGRMSHWPPALPWSPGLCLRALASHSAQTPQSCPAVKRRETATMLRDPGVRWQLPRHQASSPHHHCSHWARRRQEELARSQTEHCTEWQH